MKRSAKRVARLYLIKLAKEKSLNLQIDEKFKTWKGKNPLTKNEVGYWTVKGWKQLSKKQVSENKDKAKLQEYAIEVFKAFEEEIKGKKDDGGKKEKEKGSELDSQQKEIQESIKNMGSRPNFGLPETVFKDNKLALEIDAPSKEDVTKLAGDIREMFATPGFQRGAIAQNAATLFTDEYVKRTAKMVEPAVTPVFGVLAKIGAAAGFDWGKDADAAMKEFKETLKENKESNPEVRRMQKNLATFWTQSSFAVSAGLISTGVTASLGTAIATSAVAAGIGTAAVATVAGPAIGLVVGALGYKTLLHKRTGMVGKAKSWVKKTVKSWAGKEDDLPGSYDNLAADIYAGYATPESVQAEYQNKLDAILKDDSLEPEDARKSIMELYEDFDKNARPSIDKGLLLLGCADRGEGAGDLTSQDIKKLFEGLDVDLKDPTTWPKALGQVYSKWKDKLTFLKMGSSGRTVDLSFLKIYETPPRHLRLAADANPTPIIQQLMQYKDMFDTQELLMDAIEANPEEFGKEIQRMLAGGEEIPQEVQDYYKGDLGKEYDTEKDEEEASKKKARLMARRVARLYMRGFNR